MRIAFTKMHGLGNDFVVIDGRDKPVNVSGPLARSIADRHRGIGCDQVIILSPSARADVKLTMFNADGSPTGACGNATRCIGRLLGGDATIETDAGLLHASDLGDDVRVDMGQPVFDWDAIPLAYAMDTLTMPVGWDMLESPAAVNVGNPHVIFFVPDCDVVPLDTLGPLIEHDPLFPQRVNVNVATIIDPGHIRLRVWERGTGLTQACGTGACATAVAAIRRGLAKGPVAVDLPGGRLTIAWQPGGSILMHGPASTAFTGSFDPADYGA